MTVVSSEKYRHSEQSVSATPTLAQMHAATDALEEHKVHDLKSETKALTRNSVIVILSSTP